MDDQQKKIVNCTAKLDQDRACLSEAIHLIYEQPEGPERLSTLFGICMKKDVEAFLEFIQQDTLNSSSVLMFMMHCTMLAIATHAIEAVRDA